MDRTRFFTVIAVVFSAGSAFAKGDGSLQAPLSIPAGRPGPVTVGWGDFNADGKKDLVVANGVASNEATGSPSILVLFQNPSDRQQWKPLSLRIGSSAVFVRGADMDNDGFDDIMVADTAQSAFFVRSLGDGTFKAPAAIPQANGARWIAIADFNNDGKLDFASANFRGGNLTVFLGDGTGKFTISQTMSGSREHTLEALDFDGDGFIDLMQGSGLPGITAYKGDGKGKFQSRGQVSNLGCIEYISEVGHYKDGKYVLIGDLDKNGKGDLGVTCIDDGTAYAGVSIGNGTYRRVMQFGGGGGTDSTAFGDLNHDGNCDVAVVSAGDTKLWVHLGKGDGNLLPSPVIFGPTGSVPAFLISQDLDGDSYFDVISGEQQSFTVTIFWGKPGERFLESGINVTGYSGAKDLVLYDLNKNGAIDFLFPRSDQPVVNVFLDPGLSAAGAVRPSMTITVAGKYSTLETADLDGDGIPDLMGVDPAGGKALVDFLDPTFKPKSNAVLTPGVAPSAVKPGQFDDGAPLDLAVAVKGANTIAVYLGQAEATFAEPKSLPTVDKPKGLVVGNWDADAFSDILVFDDTTLAIHYGKGGGEFSEPAIVFQDATRLLTNVTSGDVDGDTVADILFTESKTTSYYLLKGKGGREFEAPLVTKMGTAPTNVALADMNSDGRLDVTVSATNGRNVALFMNLGAEGFAPAAGYGLGVPPAGHRVADLNLDGALDVVGFSSSASVILLGRVVQSTDGKFRRGDVSGDGLLAINDPILVLNRLFLGGEALPCEDAADADDDGALMLNDPIMILSRLFLGGELLPPPGPENCGDDLTPDEFKCGVSCS